MTASTGRAWPAAQANEDGSAYDGTRFIAYVASRLAALPSPFPCLAIVSAVLPGLARFNNAYGERATEQLRRQIYEAVRQFVPGTVIGQMSDSQFVMTYEFDAEWADIEDTASDLGAVIAHARSRYDFALGTPPMLGASVHCANTERGGALDLATEMLRQANLAAQAAPERSKTGFILYSPSEDEHVRKEVLLDRSLRQALARQEFRLFYQPIVDLRTSKPVGLESLIRWESPLEGLLNASEFIPAAEASGLIIQIGSAVIHMALQQLEEWITAGWKPPRVSINVASAQLLDDNFRSTIVQSVTRGHVTPGHLELELTERTLITWSNSTRRLFAELREMGVSIALDHFGTGYSSLHNLRDAPVTKLKIDRSFIRAITTDPRDAALVKAFVQVAQALDLEIVAEGIEDSAQTEMLLEYGCLLGQGFLFGRPRPAYEISQIFTR